MRTQNVLAALIVSLGMMSSAGILAATFRRPGPSRQEAPPMTARPQTLLAADEPLALGDVVEINVSDVVGQGVVSTKFCRIGKDGNVRLWFVNDVPATGKGTGELEQAIIKAFQDKQIISHAIVSVTAWRG